MREEKDSKSTMGTGILYDILYKADSLEQFLQKNAGGLQMPRFHDYITGLCQRRGEAPERVISRAGIENSFGHQLFKGTRKPSRDTVISGIC